MAVLRLLLRASFRQRWRSWLTLSLLVALASGLVLAATAAGRRADSAFPRYVAAHGYDAFLYSERPLPRLASLPHVASATEVQTPIGGNPTCACSHPINNNDFALMEVAPRRLPQLGKLESGVLPDQADPDQVLASFTLTQDDGVHIGTVIHVPLASPAQRRAVLDNVNLTPRGPTVALRVVGIEASELEFSAGNATSYDLYTTTAFARAINRRTVLLYEYFVRLDGGAAALPQFESQAKAIGGLSVSDLDNGATLINSSIHPQAVGWWILAGLVGLLVLAQALTRQAAVEAETFATLRALGVARRQLVLLSMTRTLLVGLAGAAGGVMLAFVLSPLTEVGEVKLADPSPGFAIDTPVLVLGALASVVAVLALGFWPALRAARATDASAPPLATRPSRVVALLVAAGAPPTALIGVRHALERGRGRGAIPVGSALLGAILAVTALCATAVFGASLTHLTSTPALYGKPYEATFGVNQTGYSAQNVAMLASLERHRDILDITAAITGESDIDGHSVGAIAAASLRGPLTATVTNGRLPDAGNQIVVGNATLRQLGAHIGSLVRVSLPSLGDKKAGSFRVVGTVVFPSEFTSGGLGTGALFTLDGLLALAGRCPAGPGHQACVVKTVISAGGAFAVRAAPGPQGSATLAQLARQYSSEVQFSSPPTNLVNFGEAVNFPLLFGTILVLFGTATLLHVLVVSVTRRRREVGLLKALGFVRRQVAVAVSWQTTTVALVGIVIGVPVGIAIGRAVWRFFANSLGVQPVPVVAAWAVGAVALGTVVIANVLAIGPAFVAARARPAGLLRSE